MLLLYKSKQNNGSLPVFVVTVNADDGVGEVLDKRSPDDQGDQVMDGGDKRAFGWGAYQWDGLQSDYRSPNEDTRSKRPFGGLLNADKPSRHLDWSSKGVEKRPFGPMYEKRARTFSFGKREGDLRKRQEEGLDDEYDLGVGKRPFGGNTHNWGSTYDDMMLDKRYLYDSQGKRKFMFGKRADDEEKSEEDDDGANAEKRLFKFGKKDDDKRKFMFGKRENEEKRKFYFGKREDGEKRKFYFGKRDDDEKRKFYFGKRDGDEKRKFLFGKRDDEANEEKRKFMFGKRDDDVKRRFLFGKRADDEKRKFMFGKRADGYKRQFMFGKRDNDM